MVRNKFVEELQESNQQFLTLKYDTTRRNCQDVKLEGLGTDLLNNFPF